MSDTTLTWSTIADMGAELGINTSGGYLKLEEGENIVRLLSEPVHYVQYFLGKGIKPVYEQNASDDIKEKFKPSHRFACYVYNYATKSIQIAEFGWSIVKTIGTWAESSQYKYDGLPPFDIIITKSGTGMKTEYKTTPGRNENPMTPEIINELSEKKNIDELLGERIAKQIEEDENPNATDEDKNPFDENIKKN